MRTKMFDTDSFAYVGDSKDYHQYSIHELEKNAMEAFVKEYTELDEDMKSVLLESVSYGEDYDRIFTEGGNMEIIKTFVSSVKSVTKKIRESKKFIKAGKNTEAKRIISEAQVELKNAKKELNDIASSYDDNISYAVIGVILRAIQIPINTIILSIPTLGIGGPLYILVAGFKQTLTSINRFIKKAHDGKEMTYGDFNVFMDAAKNGLDDISKYLVKLDQSIGKESVKKESTEEVEESSASVNGPMLPQGQGSGSADSSSVGDMVSGMEEEIDKVEKVPDDLFKEAMDDILYGEDTYFEASLGIIKNMIPKKKPVEGNVKEDIRVDKVNTAARLYSAVMLNTGRMKMMIAANPKAKSTDAYKTYKKNSVIAEKELRKILKELNVTERSYYTSWYNGFNKTFNASLNAQIKLVEQQRKESLKKESTDDIFEEAANIDEAIKDEIRKLNEKGYKTKYSSAGHNTLTKTEDRNRDGIYKGKLYTDARVHFDGNYNFLEAPKYWILKDVEGDDYLDVVPITYNPKDGNKEEAFQKWKDKYLSSLNTWIDNLPSKKNSDDVVTKDGDVTESYESIDDEIDTLVESVLSDLFVDTLD